MGEIVSIYEPYIIPGEGGLGENLEEIKAELRRNIYDTMESYSLMPRKFVSIGSAGELRAYDSEGRVTGIVNGEIREEIPYSMYDEETETVIIFPAIGSYHYEILGIGEGTYSLKIASVEYGNNTTFAATDVPTTADAVHQYNVDWDALSRGEEGVTVQCDSDGDAMFEYTFASDNTLASGEFLAHTLPDMDGNGIVGIEDIVFVSGRYGSREGEPLWDPKADLAQTYGKIDIFDLVTIAARYGEKTP
jgi:hypothetical protein